MTKEEAKEIFQRIRSEYAALPYPKYLNVKLEDLQKKYDLLMSLKEYLADLCSIEKFHLSNNRQVI